MTPGTASTAPDTGLPPRGPVDSSTVLEEPAIATTAPLSETVEELSRLLENAPGLMALRQVLAAMVPAAALDPDVPAAEHPAGSGAIAHPAGAESEAIDRITALERLKSAVTAAQVRETAALHAHRIEAETRRGVARARLGRGLGGEIGLARNIGPHSGSTELRKAVNLAADLPNTLTALQEGTVSESHAAAVERQTHWLEPAGRRAVDGRLVGLFGHAGVREVSRAAQAGAATVDPEAAEQRHHENRRERRVFIKPSESTPGMAYLTAFLPIEQAAACYEGLVAAAARRIADGEARDHHVADPSDGRGGPVRDSRSDSGGDSSGDSVGDAGRADHPEEAERTPMQVLADTLVEWLTGQRSARDVPVEVHLVMTDTALFGGVAQERAGRRPSEPQRSGSTSGSAVDPDRRALPSDEGTSLPGVPTDRLPTPPATGRTLSGPEAKGTGLPESPGQGTGLPEPSGAGTGLSRAAWLPGFGSIPASIARRMLSTTEGEVFLRRLYAVPETGQLAAMDSQRRTFTGSLRRMILVRDGTCRTPSCGAPIRHLDHATPYRDGGPTSYENGSGLCVRCNLTKEHPGWRHEATAESLTVTTPTGHRYTRPTTPLLPADPPANLSSEPAVDLPADLPATLSADPSAVLSSDPTADLSSGLAREKTGDMTVHDAANDAAGAAGASVVDTTLSTAWRRMAQMHRVGPVDISYLVSRRGLGYDDDGSGHEDAA